MCERARTHTQAHTLTHVLTSSLLEFTSVCKATTTDVGTAPALCIRKGKRRSGSLGRPRGTGHAGRNEPWARSPRTAPSRPASEAPVGCSVRVLAHLQSWFPGGPGGGGALLAHHRVRSERSWEAGRDRNKPAAATKGRSPATDPVSRGGGRMETGQAPPSPAKSRDSTPAGCPGFLSRARAAGAGRRVACARRLENSASLERTGSGCRHSGGPGTGTARAGRGYRAAGGRSGVSPVLRRGSPPQTCEGRRPPWASALKG